MNIRPIRDNVLVRPDKPRAATHSGLLIPFQARERLNNPELCRAEVVAVGPGIWTKKGEFAATRVKIGDTAIFGGINYSGVPVEEDGIEYRLLKEIDILMIEPKADKEAK